MTPALSSEHCVHLIYGKSVAVCDSHSHVDYTLKHHPPVVMLFICGYTFLVAIRYSVWRSTTVDEIRRYCITYYNKNLRNV